MPWQDSKDYIYGPLEGAGTKRSGTGHVLRQVMRDSRPPGDLRQSRVRTAANPDDQLTSDYYGQVTDSESVHASESERDAAVERLRSASAEGRLTLEELTNRTEAAHSAQTRGELAGVTADLPDVPPRTAPVQRARPHRMASVFGNITHTGWWRAEGTVSPMSLFGDVELDLRQAAVPTGEIEIKAVAPFGDIEVIVPDGVRVELTGFSVFGRKKLDIRRPASIESVPLVRVRAITVFGSVMVRS